VPDSRKCKERGNEEVDEAAMNKSDVAEIELDMQLEAVLYDFSSIWCHFID
jgi:hypothetical protein